MILWSVQTLERFDRLQKEGVLRAHRFDSEFYHPFVYEWMRQQLKDKVGPAPAQSCWPIWAWYQWSGIEKRKPELDSSHLGNGVPGVCLELEIDEKQTLLSDFDLWHMPLNCCAIMDSDTEDDRLEREIKKAGFKRPLTDSDLDKLRQEPAGKRFIASWQKVFNLEWSYADYPTSKEKKSIQAVLWEIKTSDIKKVEYFGGAVN